jgi:hypothetical protein
VQRLKALRADGCHPNAVLYVVPLSEVAGFETGHMGPSYGSL